MEPEQNLTEAQSEQEWELSDLELERSGFLGGCHLFGCVCVSPVGLCARP
jgi:hypothetical protein